MIEKVVTLNLKRREDRWLFALGSYWQCEFPFHGDSTPWGDTIVRFEAHDGLAYPDLEAIRVAMEADGLPRFENVNDHRGGLAVCWTWASALRYIVELNRTVLLILDDYSLKTGWTWWRLCRLVSEIGEPFKALQLRGDGWSKNFKPEIKPFTSMIAEGFGGAGDSAVILNREGAELLLQPLTTPEIANTIFGPPDAFEVLAADNHDGLFHTLDYIVDINHMYRQSDIQNT